jgi:hypothetical protein
MKQTILIMTMLLSLSVFATDEIRLVNKLNGKVTYIPSNEAEKYIGDDSEYYIELPISAPKPTVEIIDLQSNHSIDSRNENKINSSFDINGETITLPTDPSFYLQYFLGKATSSYYSYSNISETYGTPIPLRKSRV